MKAKDIETFRRCLLEARDRLQRTEEIRDESASTVELDQARSGRLSRMDALQDQAMAKAGQQRAELELRRIEAALARCDSGEYGDCLGCDEPIDPRRLHADPAATLCLKCAAARER